MHCTVQSLLKDVCLSVRHEGNTHLQNTKVLVVAALYKWGQKDGNRHCCPCFMYLYLTFKLVWNSPMYHQNSHEFTALVTLLISRIYPISGLCPGHKMMINIVHTVLLITVLFSLPSLKQYLLSVNTFWATPFTKLSCLSKTGLTVNQSLFDNALWQAFVNKWISKIIDASNDINHGNADGHEND
jgi:hypothetical protein